MRPILPLLFATGTATGLPGHLHGQAGRTLRGYVLSAADGAPVADAVVRPIAPSSSRLVHSGAAGRFALGIPEGPLRLLVTRIGYTPDTVSLGAGDTTVTVRLQASPFTKISQVIPPVPGLVSQVPVSSS